MCFVVVDELPGHSKKRADTNGDVNACSGWLSVENALEFFFVLSGCLLEKMNKKIQI